ncbi:hypothetical protein OJ998_02265 [Solirubrobacter taibaiensis]|nr:hypothetical protein [Solirubrobacter taibaiensis]
MIKLGLALLALVLLVLAERRNSRPLGLAGAAALLAGGVWSAVRDDRWWMLPVGILFGVLWIAFDEWRSRRSPDEVRELN